MSYGRVTLNDGNKAPRIAFGAGSRVWKHEDATQYVRQALEAGFSHLDNAQLYDNEEYVGAALAASGTARENVFITSKYSRGDVDAAIASSLSKLGVEYLDLYLIHHVMVIPEGQIPAVWAKMEAIRARGQAKSIGVSNFGVPELQQILASGTVVPAVNQIQLHPYNYHALLPIIRFCGECGIAIEAYSSLIPITRTPGGPLDPVLFRIANRINGTPAQVIFAWLRFKGIMIVTTSGKVERLEEYLDVPNLPPLTEEEVRDIERAGRQGAAWYEARMGGARSVKEVEAQVLHEPVRPGEARMRGALTVFDDKSVDVEAQVLHEPTVRWRRVVLLGIATCSAVCLTLRAWNWMASW
ncbi:Aldo/keto reductase [Exidia glandulosa HHB12029]|uniref:Aldo/keto reductase n=1 Tax=Exidia glandulosa HHB12029 TaxID=1314781 RepID=A0A165D4R8_EXIGL|nr:Aldo/keto reductase [Exidia glandulosa HHB12029]